ncbi:MAG: RepB family DNA primase [Tepidimonas taiwanensis]|nr:RepB family DNA primase [Tepidimonas taiwanensis]
MGKREKNLENEMKTQIEFMLLSCGILEFAAAEYDQKSGRVSRVFEARKAVDRPEDFGALEGWLKHKNAHGCNIWVRPKSYSHPAIMLDDLTPSFAEKIAKKYKSIAIQTSADSAQAWIICNRALSREERQEIARALCGICGSDPGAVSEPRWGRLAGFRQKKPGKAGFLTRVIAVSSENAQFFDHAPYLLAVKNFNPSPRPSGAGVVRGKSAIDFSRKEFGFAYHALRKGWSDEVIARAIEENISKTGRRKSRHYIERTIVVAKTALSINH